MINACLLICSNGIQAQTTETKPNQTKLMKQMVGIWKCNISKDTTLFWDATPYETGLLVYDKYHTKGKTVIFGKEIYGYDNSIDKYIDAGAFKGKEMGVYVFWFSSDSTYELIPYGDISNPEKALFKVEGEFKSPDKIVETETVKNKHVKTVTWTRIRFNYRP